MADFAVFDQKVQLAAVAEAKSIPGTNRRWAAEWFHNYSGHQRTPAPPFVLLVTPEKLYVWKRSASSEPWPEPHGVIDAQRVFAFYLDHSNLDTTKLRGPAFELLVGMWLDDLSHGIWQPATPEERRVLVESGLLEAVEDGRVVSEAA